MDIHVIKRPYRQYSNSCILLKLLGRCKGDVQLNKRQYDNAAVATNTSAITLIPLVIQLVLLLLMI